MDKILTSLPKTWKGVKQLFSGPLSKNLFEIPRQQPDQVTAPETMQFRASQRLLEPNALSAAVQQPPNHNGHLNVNRTGTAVRITRPAFGEIFPIGDLYNDCQEDFTGTSLFCSNIQDEAKTTSNETHHFQYISDESINEKCEKLDIRAELAMSILCGLIKVGGQGRYLTSSTSRGKRTTYSLVFKMTTKQERINLNDESVKRLMRVEGIKASSATHVITAVHHGGYATVDITYEREEGESYTDVKGKIAGALKFIVFSAKAEGKLNSNENNSFKHNRLEVKASFDGTLPAGETLPQTIEEAAAFIKKVPSWVRNSNNGKGIPILYELIPLSSFQSTFTEMEFINRISCNINEDVTSPIFEVFDKMTAAENYLCNVESDFKFFEDFLGDDVLPNIESKKKKLQNMRLKLKCKLRKINIEVRSGLAFDDAFINSTEEYSNSEVAYPKIISFCKKYLPWKEKVEFIKRLKEKNVICVGKETSLEAEKMKHDLQNFYVFYCTWSDKINRISHSELFMQLANNEVHGGAQETRRAEKKLVFVDLEVIPNSTEENVPVGNQIYEYVNGQLIDSDYLQTRKKDSNCWAKCTEERKFASEKPNMRINFDSPCPLSFLQQQHHCDKKECEWHCFDCRKRIQYDFKGNFYCDCGFAHISTFEYCCSDPLHGNAFIKFDEERLLHLVTKLRVNNDMNILLLSEPGINTYMWIYNYAASVTNSPKIEIKHTLLDVLSYYTFRHGKKTIRIIDVSFLCNSKDNKKQYISQTWDSITSKFKELHGICVLVKPNNFINSIRNKWYIMNGLLSTLPCASKNFVFCVTSCKDRTYRPGETLEPIIKMLTGGLNINVEFSPETVYYLADGKIRDNPLLFERNGEESRRLLNHFENDVWFYDEKCCGADNDAKQKLKKRRNAKKQKSKKRRNAKKKL
uniref:Uncharacterized protein n=1 Tax=Panagrolaimus sp. ES5 TaxID=591445 RepID=A0AC34F059_9BILA